MLDTNTCIYLMRGDSEHMRVRFNAYQTGDILISSITVAELEYGVSKSVHIAKNRAALDKFLVSLNVTLFDADGAREYGAIRVELERRGTIIGAMDLLIAAHALQLGVPLVTNNVREFSRVPGLVVENWVNT